MKLPPRIPSSLRATAALSAAALTAGLALQAVPAGASPGPLAFSTIQFPGSEGTIVTCFGPHGMVGGEYWDAGKPTRGFVYQHGKYLSINDNGAPGQKENEKVVAITQSGDIIGDYTLKDGTNVGYSEKDQVFTDISDQDASTFPDRGTVIQGSDGLGNYAGYFVDTSNKVNGFVDVDGTFTTINSDDNPSSETVLNGITASAELVVGESGSHGFVAESGVSGWVGQVVKDADAPPGTSNALTGVAPNSGEMVGVWYRYGKQFTGYHGYSEKSGVISDVTDPAGTGGTYPDTVTDAGRVAGYFVNANGKVRGFIAEPEV